MNIFYLILAISLLFTCKLEAKKIEGQIILEHDTLHVTFNIPIKLVSEEPNYLRLQNYVTYYDAQGEKKVLAPCDAKEFRFKYRNDTIRMVSSGNTMQFEDCFSSTNKTFLHLKMDGNLKLYIYFEPEYTSIRRDNRYEIREGGRVGYKKERYILQKGDGELKGFKKFGFRKDLMAYFEDCPVLSAKIEDEKLRKKNMEYIVSFYNGSCK